MDKDRANQIKPPLCGIVALPLATILLACNNIFLTNNGAQTFLVIRAVLAK